MTEIQIKEYLNKYSLTTKEKLAQHILELKRNTKPNLELISQLNYVLVDEENLFFNVFCGEKEVKVDWIDFISANMKRGKVFTYKPPQAKVSPHFMDEVLEQTNSAEKENKEQSSKTEEIKYRYKPKDNTKVIRFDKMIKNDFGEEELYSELLYFDRDSSDNDIKNYSDKNGFKKYFNLGALHLYQFSDQLISSIF
jgi:hypothetical protein